MSIVKTLQKSTALLSLLCCLCIVAQAQANDLSKIQKQIKQQEQKIAEQKRQQNKLQSSLKNQETEINMVLNQLQQTEMSLKEIRQSINETNKQIKQLQKQEAIQKAKLSKQLDSIYRANNNPSAVEKLLSDEAKKSERMMKYYEHMNRARLQLINDLKHTQQELEKNKEFILGQQKNEQTQLQEQKKQQQILQKAQDERKSTLNQLTKSLEKNQNKLETLRANERALNDEIKRAEQAAREQEKKEREALAQKQQAEEKKNNKPYKPTAQEKQLMIAGGGLGAAKKQYHYPVSGKILHSFGSSQGGEVRWKGIVIGASAGTPVRAIAGGRVIMANWLSGYGLMVVIEHGQGDLSLYGYNQSVSVKVNSYVSAGQQIATVGTSGGQSRSALYFGITRKGNAVNPTGWLK
ncbi:septal ring factor EnvC (AmiA/AmiB activator) [Cricetibacter osteomyelitidis]|uniref:Septal ring factor EnvC (AmiA/AmiB activator) n=1 Tax=Cricetibacter osteomyelitidis TaxID=1521931 RepID=A0A4R2SPJ7_9PAST|nr:murein hydrolase activator EnvC [Cricetibacter osteomyelitidis]TCP91160.1 septal ring factor EnvC (AmiA/AmiB activator) [Cricetibacter osteomyelitidis]